MSPPIEVLISLFHVTRLTTNLLVINLLVAVVLLLLLDLEKFQQGIGNTKAVQQGWSLF
jgi:hypothetical protein